MENYWQWKLMKDVKRARLISGVVPHIFNCQKKNVQPSVERTAAKKRKHMQLVQEALADCNTPKNDNLTTVDWNAPSTSGYSTTSTLSISDNVPIASFSLDDMGQKDKCVQVNIKHYFRSKGTNTNVVSKSIGCSTSIATLTVATNTSPIKLITGNELEDSGDVDENFEPSSSDFDSSEEEDSSDNFISEDETDDKIKFKDHMFTGTIMSIEKEPKLYLGLPKQSFYIVKLLAEISKLPLKNIYIVLKKIRLNSPFAVLAVDFGLAASSICRIFSKSLPVVASFMQELIVSPESKCIQAHLPITFRARYGHVISIIDCLEIEIEKPTNPIAQALTWSNYYGCNTLKYLVSCTPDGLINFVSEGFGGRASDVIIVENSGYLGKVQNASIMADRGFKNISVVLQQKNCTLIRPPSVSCTTKSTKEEVKEAKMIAALRIHVERVIRRLREFNMLTPHACIDRQLISILDYAVIIACGIINMQDPLIK